MVFTLLISSFVLNEIVISVMSVRVGGPNGVNFIGAKMNPTLN